MITRTRKYPLDESYFDTIDTEEKAYFLGFLYADGYNNINRKDVTIKLAESDKEILEKLQNLIQPGRPLIFINRQAERNQGKKNQDCYVLTFHSEHLSKRLEELGVIHNKTYDLQFPTEEQIPKHLLNHFIRGFSDGDGYISKDACLMVATVDFCRQLGKYLKTEYELTIYIGNPKGSKNSINRISISGAIQSIKFQDLIYKNATIYLQRKFDKYKENLNLILNKKQHFTNGKAINYQNSKKK
jgi:hypothetical protein